MNVEELREALARIGPPLRTDAFNYVLAGKDGFEAMILRDDEPGCAAILAQQMSDQCAEDFVTVINGAAELLAATAPITGG